MQFITTTELRTKSTELIQQLQQGNVVPLIHRSKIVGMVVPAKQSRSKAVSAEVLRAFHKKFGLKTNTTVEEREKRYTEQIEKRYGKRK